MLLAQSESLNYEVKLLIVMDQLSIVLYEPLKVTKVFKLVVFIKMFVKVAKGGTCLTVTNSQI